MGWSFLIQFLINTYITLFKARLQFFRGIQSYLGSFGLSRFVSEASNSKSTRQLYNSAIETLVNIAVALAPLPMLLSVYYDEISKTDFLDDFFSRYKYYVEVKRRRESPDFKFLPNDDTDGFSNILRQIYYLLGLSWGVNDPITRTMIKVADLISLGPQIYQEPEKLFGEAKVYAENLLNDADFTIGLAFISPLAWRAIIPSCDLDWAIIKSYIALLDAYQKISQEEEQDTLIPPFFPQQKFQLWVGDRLITETRLDAEGCFNIEFDITPDDKMIKLASHGLELEIPIKQVLSGWALYNASQRYWILPHMPNWRATYPSTWTILYEIEDTLPYEKSDQDHNDCWLYLRDEIDKWYAEIWTYEHWDTLEVWYKNTRIITLPRQTEWKWIKRWSGRVTK